MLTLIILRRHHAFRSFLDTNIRKQTFEPHLLFLIPNQQLITSHSQSQCCVTSVHVFFSALLQGCDVRLSFGSLMLSGVRTTSQSQRALHSCHPVLFQLIHCSRHVHNRIPTRKFCHRAQNTHNRNSNLLLKTQHRQSWKSSIRRRITK
jgi:hypothetical protein